MDVRRTEKLIRRTQSASMTRRSRFFDRVSKILAYSLGLFLFSTLFVRWQQTAAGTGRVIAFSPGERLQNVTANVEGRIRKWFVREGSRVAEGDLIAEIADNDPDILQRLQDERKATLQRMKVIEVSIAAAEKNLGRQRELFKDGIASERAVELAEIDLAKFMNDRAAAEVELARIDVRFSRQSMQEVRAPITGIIQKIRVGENSELLKAGDMIAVMVPESSDRVVELNLRGRDLPFIHLGQRVQLQFDGWPILQFSGIPELSVGTFRGKVQVIDPSDDGQGNFRVIVAAGPNDIWPVPSVLRQGVRAKGWVQMGRVPLWFEIWRNLNSLPPMQPPVFDHQLKTDSKEKGS